MEIQRRQILRGLIAAPLIVSASSLMKIVAPAQGWPYYGGLATLTRKYTGLADFSQTIWQHSQYQGWGFLTTGMAEAKDPDIWRKQMVMLKEHVELRHG